MKTIIVLGPTKQHVEAGVDEHIDQGGYEVRSPPTYHYDQYDRLVWRMVAHCLT